MKYVVFAFFVFISLLVNAQQGTSQTPQNTLLDQSFWQRKPGVDEIKTAVAKGNDPAELNSNAFDPVVMAINSGAPDEAIIYLVEQKGNDINKLTHDSRTYIFWSASKGNVNIMRYLLDKGAKINLQDSHGMTPINFAAGAGQQNTKVYELLLEKGANLKADLSPEGANALLLSISNDSSFALANYFQSKGLSLSSKDGEGNTAFDYAARSGNIKVMEALKQKGIEPGSNALQFAAQGSRRGANTIEVFKYLESIGIKPATVFKNGENALHSIVRRSKQSVIINYFLEKGTNVNLQDKNGNTPFMNAAAVNQDTSTINLLVLLVKDINQKNNAGNTALSLAVRNNSFLVVQSLINSGADVNVKDSKGNNLVFYLFESYRPAQVKDFQQKLNGLQQKGLDVSAPLSDSSTLYHLAVSKKDLSLIKLVHDNYSINVNAKNKEGLTALHKAAMVAKDNEMLEYLVSIGADKQIKTGFNETSYDLAIENELLKKNNVSVDFLK